MSAKNIQEFVAGRVIYHLKYRDDEMSKLASQLATCEALLRSVLIFKCANCSIYSEECKLCEACNKHYCTYHCTCTYEGIYEDTHLCGTCIESSCFTCGGVGYSSCRKCKTILCNKGCWGYNCCRR